MKKNPYPVLTKQDQFELYVRNIAGLELRQRRLIAQKDEEIQKVQERFSGEETRLQLEMDWLTDRAAIYAGEHRAELFPAKKKSAETPFAEFGFRKAKHALVLIKKKFGWDNVVKVIKAAGHKNLIATEEKVNKDAVKAAKFSEALLQSFGLKMTQKEVFYVEPKLDGAVTQKGEA